MYSFKTSPPVSILVTVVWVAIGTCGDAPMLEIVSPLAGTTIAPGDSIRVEVHVAEHLRPTSGVLLSFPGGARLDELQPYEWEIRVPQDQSPGDFRIGALARVGESTYSADVNLKVAPPSSLVTLRVVPDNIILDDTSPPVFYVSQQPLQVEGLYEDGRTDDLTLAPQIRFEVTDTSVAALGFMEPPSPPHPWVRGLREGQTVVVVRYKHHVVEVPIRVRATLK